MKKVLLTQKIHPDAVKLMHLTISHIRETFYTVL